MLRHAQQSCDTQVLVRIQIFICVYLRNLRLNPIGVHLRNLRLTLSASICGSPARLPADSLCFPRRFRKPGAEGERHRPDVNHFAVGQRVRRTELGVAHERAVRAVQILQRHAPPRGVNMDTRVTTRDARLVEPDHAAGVAPDQVVAFGEGKCVIIPDKPTPGGRRPSLGGRPRHLGNLAEERVANAMNRADKPRPLRRVSERPTDLPNQHVEICLANERIRPDARDELGFVDDAGTPLDEGAQQIEGFRRQVDLLLIAEDLAGVGVDDKVCKAQSHV
jgi:hypothetical protein